MRTSLTVTLAIALVTISLRANAQQTPTKPLTLDESIAIALKGNPRIASAKHEGEIQLIQLDRERPSGLRPSISVSASHTLTAPEVPFPNGLGPTVTPRSRPAIGVNFAQMIFHFGARLAGRRAQFIERAVELDRKKTEADVILDVKKAYFNVLTAEQMVEVAREAVKQVEAHIRVAQVAVDAGTAMALDLTRADVELSNTHNMLVKAENGLALAQANFNRTLGRDQDMPVALVGVESLPPEPPVLEQTIAAALKQRSELAALRETIKAIETSIQLARTQKLPSASVRGSMTHQRESAFIRSPSWVAGVEISMPLFDHKTDIDVREARARYAQMQSALKEAEAGMALEARHAWLNYQEARNRAVTLPRSIEASRDALRIAELRFEAGRATYLEVSDAMLQARRTRADYVQALSDLHIAAAELEKAIGGTPGERVAKG